ncbi:MAG: hypothetical protein EOO38_16305, partial [Cytophagaceae bacterium]
MGRRKVWIITIVVVILILVLIWVLFPQIVAKINNKGDVYNLYGYQYIDGTYALGPVVETYDNVESALICANYAAMTDSAVGANYNAATLSCSLVSDLLPLQANSKYQLVVLGANKMKNKVSAFTPTQGIRSKGILYCGTALSYLPAAAAICANTPSCSGYTATFQDTNSLPAGCLVTDSATSDVTTIDTKALLYTGPRTDGVLYN